MFGPLRSIPSAFAWLLAGIVFIVAAGLLVDRHVVFGQHLVNGAVWFIFVAIVVRAARIERLTLLACLVYATLGEITLSLVWGLYDYRLGGIPLFVPPGHALLFMLGTTMAARMSDRMMWCIPVTAAPFVVWLAVSGIDTLSLPLFVLLVLCMIFGPARRLYATMFMLALAMEIYGTWLGNWTWMPQIDGLNLVTTNPPLAAGAFYCVLDLLVNATAAFLHRRRARAISLGICSLSQQR